MSAIGAVVMIAVNVLLVPRIGYWACAWGGFAGYGTAMLLSLFIGGKYYPVPYDWKAILGFMSLTAGVYALISALYMPRFALNPWLVMAAGTILLGVYSFFAWREIKKS